MYDSNFEKTAGKLDTLKAFSKSDAGRRIGKGIGTATAGTGLLATGAAVGHAKGKKKGKREIAAKFNDYNKQENRVIASRYYGLGRKHGGMKKKASDELSPREEYLAKVAELAYEEEMLALEKEAGIGGLGKALKKGGLAKRIHSAGKASSGLSGKQKLGLAGAGTVATVGAAGNVAGVTALVRRSRANKAAANK